MDLQEVTADLTVNYRLAADKVDTIFVNLGRGYESSVILPAVDESLKAVTAQFTAEEPITRRDTVKAALTDNLQSRLAVFNIEVITVSFTDFQFSDLARAPRWRIKESPEIANQQYGLSPTRYGRRHRRCPGMLPPCDLPDVKVCRRRNQVVRGGQLQTSLVNALSRVHIPNI
jgi:hypothetical protein